MKTRMIAGALGLLLFYCCFAVPAADAQGKCSMQTMAGTYVFSHKGSSSILDPTVQPYPFHLSGATAPFITVGEISFTPDGEGDGFYWIRIGTLNAGLDPVPVHVTITEMNEDCTGKMRYDVSLPGIPSATIEERFISFDNGREFRSVPVAIVNGVYTLAWIGTGHRISKSSGPVNSCGPQTVHGTYLVTAENIIAVNPTTAFFDTILFRLNISLNGDYTGMLYEKLGPISVELPVSGTFTVNPDCSYSWNLNVQGIPGTIGVRGVFFNEGKELYGLAMDPEGIKYSFAQGKRVSQ